MENEDEMEMIDVKVISVSNEKSPFVADRGAVATDDIIEEFFRHRTWKYTLLVLSLMITMLGGPAIVYLTAFAGISVNVLKLFAKPCEPSVQEKICI